VTRAQDRDRRPAASPDAERPRVAIVQQIIPHYRERFYELLRERLEDDGVQLVVIHSNHTPPADGRGGAVELPWAHEVPARAFTIAGRQLIYQRCRGLLADCELVIVEQASRHLLNYLLLGEQVLGRRRVALWGHGRNFNPEDASRIGEALKARWSRVAHWWFAYNQRSADVVAGLGVPRDRITVLNNAIDTRELQDTIATLTVEDEERIRREIGLEGDHVGLFVGALVADKRLEYLVEAGERVREAVPDFELVIAGAGPEDAAARQLAATRPWVHVVGARRGRDKAALLALSQLLLLPAAAGLVVLDGCAAGLPIVVSRAMPHGPELSYVEEAGSGLIVDDRGDPRRYADAVIGLLLDDESRAALRAGALAAASRYTVEDMVDRFAAGIMLARDA
jgi:glycosyltransferase involved in cell wall biosynthesis